MENHNTGRLMAPGNINKKVSYVINEEFLKKLGFIEVKSAGSPETATYRYHNPAAGGTGFDLIYVKEFGIVSVEEFWTDMPEANNGFRNMIMGVFRIESDNDLAFIFLKNVRLCYTFQTSVRRLVNRIAR